MAPARFIPGIHPDKTKKTGSVSINVILRRVRITIVALEKPYVLQILACVCSLIQPTFNVFAPCNIVICGLPCSTVFFHIFS
jgi:hypothetical protein